MTDINVECKGDNGTIRVDKVKAKLKFGTKGNCKFLNFGFDGGTPKEFTDRDPPTGGGDKISYEYSGKDLPIDGYKFSYSTDAPPLGDGTGVIKNK